MENCVLGLHKGYSGTGNKSKDNQVELCQMLKLLHIPENNQQLKGNLGSVRKYL